MNIWKKKKVKLLYISQLMCWMMVPCFVWTENKLNMMMIGLYGCKGMAFSFGLLKWSRPFLTLRFPTLANRYSHCKHKPRGIPRIDTIFPSPSTSPSRCLPLSKPGSAGGGDFLLLKGSFSFPLSPKHLLIGVCGGAWSARQLQGRQMHLSDIRNHASPA